MKIEVFRQSSIRLEGSKVIYFDPYKIKEDYNDADYVFITHDHYDHYDPESLKRVLKPSTKLIVPKCLENINYQKIVVEAEGQYSIDGLSFRTVSSYNINKPYHPKEKGYVGYLVTIDEKVYYIMGDSDATEEAMKVKCDYLFVPIGGTYTMNLDEALEYTMKIKPKKVIPIHYGSIVGDISLGEEFKRRMNKDIEVDLLIKEEI